MILNISFTSEEIASFRAVFSSLEAAFAKALPGHKPEGLTALEDFDVSLKHLKSFGTKTVIGYSFGIETAPEVATKFSFVMEEFASMIEDLAIAGLAFWQVSKRAMKSYAASAETFSKFLAEK